MCLPFSPISLTKVFLMHYLLPAQIVLKELFLNRVVWKIYIMFLWGNVLFLSDFNLSLCTPICSFMLRILILLQWWRCLCNLMILFIFPETPDGDHADDWTTSKYNSLENKTTLTMKPNLKYFGNIMLGNRSLEKMLSNQEHG